MDIWRDLKRATQQAWLDKSEQERRIELPGGGSVSVKSADDPSSLVGVGLDGMVMDETGRTDPQAWYESLRPTLSDTRGWSLFLGTPKGQNWFYDLFQAAEVRETWERWQRPTRDNPIIPPEEIEQARLDVGPRIFAQEYEAQFTDIEGAEWPSELFGPDIWFDEWPSRFEIKTMGIDPSKGRDAKSGDYSAMVMLGRDFQGQYWCEADLRKDRNAAEIVEESLDHAKRFQPDGMGWETNLFADLFINLLEPAMQSRRMEVPIYRLVNTVPKPVRIRRLTPLLTRKRIKFKSHSKGTQLLVEQLRGFTGKPNDVDDGPDALEDAHRVMRFLLEGKESKVEGIQQLRA